MTGRRNGISFRLALIIGAVVASSSVAMALSALVALVFGEIREAGLIALAALTTGVAGMFSWRVWGRPGPISAREGFAAVGLAWFVMSLFGTLPYLFTGEITSFTDAFFETASGFTTTGASIVADPRSLSHGIVFWRSLTQWMGGMGIIVLSVAVLPLLGVGGVQLARAESPGPAPDRLTPRFQETAKRLWLFYAALTGLQVLLLLPGDMDLFQAINHAFTTLSTGGFGTEPTSIAGFSAYTQWVVIVFMFLAGASFALHVRALRDPGAYFRNAEFVLYGAIVAGATLLILGGLLGPGVDLTTAVREAAFTALTIVTTTGFATADFGAWRPALQILILGLMFVGGMAGSTAGGVKTFRIGILGKAAHADLRRIVHPRGVFVTRFGGQTVNDPIVTAVQSFFLFYIVLFVVGTFLVAFIDANTRESLDFLTSISAVAASIGNIGPGLGEVGPTSNYLAVPDPAKWVLALLMIVGRLEIFPVLVLFTRDLWRR